MRRRLDRERAPRGERHANPGLYRIAFKMATGSGKTVVMAMLIAWHALNKLANPQDARFSDTFLIVTPGITIRDRLRVLLPNDPGNYYRQTRPRPAGPAGDARPGQDRHHQLPRLPAPREGRGRQAHQGDPRRRRARTSAVHRDARPDGAPRLPRARHQEEHRRDQRRGPPLLPAQARTRRGRRSSPATSAARPKKRDEEARVWISGLEAVKAQARRARPSTTSRPRPFFLRGSGYPEGTLFPWVVSRLLPDRRHRVRASSRCRACRWPTTP